MRILVKHAIFFSFSRCDDLEIDLDDTRVVILSGEELIASQCDTITATAGDGLESTFNVEKREVGG